MEQGKLRIGQLSYDVILVEYKLRSIRDGGVSEPGDTKLSVHH